MDESTDLSSYLVSSLDRGLAALNQFVHKPEMTFSEFMKACELNKAAAKRTLYTLEHNGMLKYNPHRKTYYLGIRVFELGTVAGENLALLKVARPYMESVCSEIKETVLVAQKVDDQQVYLHKIEDVGTVHLATLIGHRRPLYYGLGKTLLAYMCDDDIADCLPQIIPAYSTKTLVERELFLNDIAEVRKRGYAIDHEEYIQGVTGVGFPIFLRKVNIFGLIGVVAPTGRLTGKKLEAVVKLLTKVSATISLKLDEYIYDT